MLHGSAFPFSSYTDRPMSCASRAKLNHSSTQCHTTRSRYVASTAQPTTLRVDPISSSQSPPTLRSGLYRKSEGRPGKCSRIGVIGDKPFPGRSIGEREVSLPGRR